MPSVAPSTRQRKAGRAANAGCEDENPRPSKRQRTESLPPSDTDQYSELSSLPPSSDPALRATLHTHASQDGLKPIPAPILLVSLPSLLAHPPNHKFYIHSLVLSLAALRKCLALPALAPDIECRAWMGIAELGMRVIGGGLSQSEEHAWAQGTESEVEKALNRGSIIAQKHPSLRAYKHQLALLQAQLSQWQQKTKFARNQIRNLISSLSPMDPSHIVYSAHLALITLLTAPNTTKRSTTANASDSSTPRTNLSHARSSSLSQPSAQDVHAALAAVQELEDRAIAHKHNQVALFARVLRARILVAASMWDRVKEAIQGGEEALGLSYEPTSPPKRRKPPHPSQGTSVTDRSQASKTEPQVPEQTFIMFEDAFEAAMAVHLLMLSVVYHTHAGVAAEVSPRLSHLHALLDSEVLAKFPEGNVEIMLPDGPSLVIQVTHPRIVILLTFLVSSTAKRDVVGRKPRRKVFATEGLKCWDTESARELNFSLWSSIGDVEEVEGRLVRIKADLLCEIIAVSIMRSDFDAAEKARIRANLDILIAHTRTYDIFSLFSARIALHHAHLAHALGRPARALACYRAAAHHSELDSFLNVAARAGEISLCVGVRRRKELFGDAWMHGLSETDDEWPEDEDPAELERRGFEMVKLCRGQGGTMEAIGHILEACFSPEILKAKQHLKLALEIASRAVDNHLRALVLALIAGHYVNTASEHARNVLQTCEQLAAGLGAPPAKGATADGEDPMVGNAPLGLWVGERFLEMYKRFGKDARAQKQAVVNEQLAKAVQDLALRGCSS